MKRWFVTEKVFAEAKAQGGGERGAALKGA